MAYTVIADYAPEDVLPHVGRDAPERVYAGYRVRMDSLRYQVFARDACRCVVCGVVGTIFRLERKPDPKQPPDRAHFNLYARVGDELVLMTKDHTVARSRGGKDHLSNLRTMCFPCNYAKADSPA